HHGAGCAAGSEARPFHFLLINGRSTAMTDQAPVSPAPTDEPSPQDGGNTLSPLPGEAGIPNVARRQTVNLSWKNISIIGLVLFMVGGITASYLYRFFAESGDS